MPTLLETLEKIQSNPELTKRFLTDPEAALREQGVETSSLRITKTSDPQTGWVRPSAVEDRVLAKDLAAFKPDAINRLRADQLRATICGSIGYIVCGSVGD